MPDRERMNAIKSGSMLSVGDTTHMGEKRNAHRFVVAKAEETILNT
jgi:hypothetical protein